MGEINIKNSDTHNTPSAGYTKLYPKTDKKYYIKDEDGLETPLSCDEFINLTDTPSSYSGEALKVLRVNAGEDAIEFANPGTTTSESVIMLSLGTPDYTTLKNWWDSTQSAGIISGGTITDAGSGNINVSEVQGIIKLTNSEIGENKFFELAAVSDQAITDSSINYVAVDYNSGTPQLSVSTSNSSNGRTIFNLGKVYREGTTIDIINSGVQLQEITKRIQQHNIEEASLHFVSGAIVSATGTRNVYITAGVMYAGLNRITTPIFDSSATDTFEYYYYNGSAWVESDATQINNTQYNNIATGLATLANNQYGVHWVYKGTNGNCYVIYGQSSYTLSGAQSAQPPSSIPSRVEEMGVLRAKIIIKKSGTTFTEIESVTDVQFTASSPSNHNDLGGLQGGTADQYYHLTSTEHPYVSGANAQSLLTTASPTFTGETLDAGGLVNTVLNINGSTNSAIRSTATDLLELVHNGVTPISINTSGVSTFSSFPITPSSAPTTDYQVANKKYVDDNSGGDAAGSDTQVQFNDGGADFGGDSGLTYDKTNNVLIVTGSTNDGTTKTLSIKDSDTIEQSYIDTEGRVHSAYYNSAIPNFGNISQSSGISVNNSSGSVYLLVGGLRKITLDTSATFSVNGLFGINGTVSVPAISFGSTGDVGFYKNTTNDSMVVSVNDTAVAEFDDTTAISHYMPTSIVSLTTTERDALTPTAGWVIYNETTNKHQGYNGSTWNDFY